MAGSNVNRRHAVARSFKLASGVPVSGYNMGTYFAHWLSAGNKLSRAPKIFHVNWFRARESGEFLWPGFGDEAEPWRAFVERFGDRVPRTLLGEQRFLGRRLQDAKHSSART